MRYIIFGCGDIGKKALRCIGPEKVLCFIDNRRGGETVCGKRVLFFPEAARLCTKEHDAQIVIASNNYGEEMEAQVREEGISRCSVFSESEWPFYMRNRERIYQSLQELIENFGLAAYRRIGIYGDTFFADCLAEELRQRTACEKVCVSGSQDRNGDSKAGSALRLSPETAGELDCLCIAVSRRRDVHAIRERAGEIPCPVIDLYDVDQFESAFRYEGLEKYRNIHRGRRIFVIGNGPSLTIEDLNTLHEHGEICFACNKIYRAYDRTPWRADYLGFTDDRVIEDCEADIPNLPGTVILADTFHFSPNKRFENMQYYHMPTELSYPNFPGFSDDASKKMYNGMTVVYDMGLQLAAYMGAREIYLLGVDNSRGGSSAVSPENYFIADYVRPEEEAKYRAVSPDMSMPTRAYEKAEIYSRAHGFRIFNATRGGKLEVFERVDFDSLF